MAVDTLASVARFAIAKYVPDPLRMEPRNIGIIVWSEDASSAMFLGERKINGEARIDSRSVPSFVSSKSAYRQWIQYWRNAIRSDYFEPPMGGESISVHSLAFIDTLLTSSKGNFGLVEGGKIFEPVSINNIEEVTRDLFLQLVTESGASQIEPEDDSNIQRVCDRIIAQLDLTKDPNFKRQMVIPYKTGKAELDLEFDYGYQNGCIRRVYRRVPLSDSRREREHSVLSSLYAFSAVVESGCIDRQKDAVALVSISNSVDRTSKEILGYLEALSESGRVVDVRDQNSTRAEFESLKKLGDTH